MADKIQYDYPVEELDKTIEKLQKGITPMMTDDYKRNVELRYLELQKDSLDDEQADLYERKKSELIHDQIEKKRREATKTDVVIIKLSDDQERTLREEMESSIVRCDPNSSYNKSDEEIFDSEEKRVIYHKLSRLKNCYYDQKEYVAAIQVIQEAIEYSLNHDYPWMSHAEAVNAFNNGAIKFTFCNIPKLYINWNTQITDPEILRGVVNGEVVLQTKEEALKTENKAKRDSKPVDMPYTTTSEAEYNEFFKYHQMGYDTPITPFIKFQQGRYNRFALPGNNRFGKQNEEHVVINSFDWERPGAGKLYYDMMNNVKYTTYDFIHDVNAANGGNLNTVLGNAAGEFLRALKTYDPNYKPEQVIQPLTVNEKAFEIEKGILDRIRMSNPTF